MARKYEKTGKYSGEAYREMRTNSNIRTAIQEIADRMGVSKVGSTVNENFGVFKVPTKKEYNKEYNKEQRAKISYTDFLKNELRDMQQSLKNLQDRTGVVRIDFRKQVELRNTQGELNAKINFAGQGNKKIWDTDRLDLIQPGQTVSRYKWVSHNKFIDILDRNGTVYQY